LGEKEFRIILPLEKSEESAMSKQILVGYATRYGSIEETAEQIAAVLRDGSLDVHLQRLSAVKEVAKYSAVVLGAPLFMFRWHKDAHRFLQRFQRPLDGKPLAIFALGPTHDPHDAQEWADSQTQLDQELAKHPWLKPSALVLLGGKYDPTVLRFPLKLFAGSVPASDIRDYAAIRNWAEGLKPLLLKVQYSDDAES